MGKKGENIYKRKDGRWEARYIKGHRPDGGIRYGYCYGRTYHEAKGKVTQAKAAVMNHQPLLEKSRRKRFGVYCDEWLHLKRSSVKESTFNKYEINLEKHIKPRLGEYFSDILSEMMIEQFGYELLHEEMLSAKTVRDILSMLHSILEYAERQNPLMEPIRIVYPKENPREMRVLSCDEQKRFTEYLLKNMDECRFGVLLALLTGLRIGEVCALKWENISTQNRTILVKQTMQRMKNTDSTGKHKTRIVLSTPKSNTSARVIPLSNYTAGLCERWQVRDPEAYILTGEAEKYLEPRTLQNRMKRYTKDCGLEGVHFHTLRHSFATRCVEVGFELKSLSEILGHSSTKITLECYVHSSMELKRENMEKLSEKLNYTPS